MAKPVCLDALLEKEQNVTKDDTLIVLGPGYDLNPYSREYKLRNARTTAWSPGHT